MSCYCEQEGMQVKKSLEQKYHAARRACDREDLVVMTRMLDELVSFRSGYSPNISPCVGAVIPAATRIEWPRTKVLMTGCAAGEQNICSRSLGMFCRAGSLLGHDVFLLSCLPRKTF
jgi:hypothetical protein